jgi:hypothetical protein
MLAHDGNLYLAVNHDGLLFAAPLEGGDIGLYRVTGTGPGTAAAVTEYWDSYTVGNLFLYDEKPSVFFYRDDRFADPAPQAPAPPVLSLDTFTGLRLTLQGLDIPALAALTPVEGWEPDILRGGADGRWYFRVFREKNGGRETRYFRSESPSLPAEEINAGTYRNSQAPTGSQAPAGEVADSALPPLPEDFAYSHVVRLGDLIFAAWEEQEDYSIGAAGFMVFRP